MYRIFILFMTLQLIVSCSQVTLSNSLKQKQQVVDLEKLVDIPVKKYSLDNGLTLLVVENNALPIFSYYTFYNVGGRYESGTSTGATHFLEHLMFKGTKNYPFGIFDSEIEGNGGNTNAYTTFDQTVYHESVPVSQLDNIIKMEVDRMSNLVIKNDLFEKERAVILEERKMRYENSPSGKLYLTMMQSMFEGTPYGGSVIGEAKNIKEFTPKIIMDFYNKFYAPNNAVVVVVGDVKSDDVYESVKKQYGILEKSEKFQKIKEQRDKKELYTFRGKYKREINQWSSSPTPVLMMGFKGFDLNIREALVADILMDMLSGSTNSYLMQKYVHGKRPKMSSISANNYNLKMNGIFFFYAQLLRKANLNSVKKSLKQEYKTICEKGLNVRAMLRTKNQFLVHYFEEIQTNAGVAQFVGVRESMLGDYEHYKKELKVYNELTLDEVRNVCHKIFDTNEYILLTTWNKNPRKKK